MVNSEMDNLKGRHRRKKNGQFKKGWKNRKTVAMESGVIGGSTPPQQGGIGRGERYLSQRTEISAKSNLVKRVQCESKDYVTSVG